MNGAYNLLLTIAKPLGVLAFAGGFARGFVAYAAWRMRFRGRLLGEGPGEQGAVSALGRAGTRTQPRATGSRGGMRQH